MLWLALLVAAVAAASALGGGGAAPAQAPPPKKPGFPAPGGGELPDVTACLDDNLPPAIRDQIAGLLQQASIGTVAPGALLAAANVADQFQAPKAAACLRKAAAVVPGSGGGISGLVSGFPAQSASTPFAPMIAAAGAIASGLAYKMPAQPAAPGQPGAKPLSALPTGVGLDPSRDWFTWITDCVSGLPPPYRDIMWLGLDRAWKGQLSEDQMNAAWNQMNAMGYPKVATCIANVRDEAVNARDAKMAQDAQLAALKAAGF